MELNASTTSIAPVVARKLVKKVAAKAAPAAKPVSAAKANAAVLKALCGKLGVEPRVARRRLRAAKLSFHVLRERWIFTPKQMEQVTSIIEGGSEEE